MAIPYKSYKMSSTFIIILSFFCQVGNLYFYKKLLEYNLTIYFPTPWHSKCSLYFQVYFHLTFLTKLFDLITEILNEIHFSLLIPKKRFLQVLSGMFRISNHIIYHLRLKHILQIPIYIYRSPLLYPTLLMSKWMSTTRRHEVHDTPSRKNI